MSQAPSTVNGHFVEFQIGGAGLCDGLTTTTSSTWRSRTAPSYWGTTCKNAHCSEPLVRQEVRDGYRSTGHRRCAHCNCFAGDDLQLTLAGASLAAANADVPKREWWHSSKSDLRQGTLRQDSVMHLGSRDAAMHRMLTTNGRQGDLRYLHRMTLRDIALIANVVIEPPVHQIDRYLRCFPVQAGEALRYVNRHEAPGDISLVVLGSEVVAHPPDVFHLQQPGGGKVAIYSGSPV